MPDLQVPLITLENASFGYNKKPVIRNVSLVVRRGEFIGIVGPNGAGKTTLFRGILGLIPPIEGRVIRAAELHRRIGYVPQRDQLDSIYPVTASDVVYMGLVGILPWYRFPGETALQTIQASLDKVGMLTFSNHPFAELSGGQRQRVLIARALAIAPLLLVLDEPTAGIDPAAEESILLLLDKLQEQGETILMVSHRLQALHKHARRVIEVKDQGISEQ